MAIDEPVREQDSLLLDQLSSRLDSLRLFREHDEAEAKAGLEAFGSSGVIEDQMLKELSSRHPLKHPARFDEAHRRAMRALEVFDRNGARRPSALRVPRFVKPLADKVVQLLITAIVRSHQKRLVRDLRQLYALREANSAVGSDDYQLLATARIQVDAIRADLDKSSLPLPAFLVGGAALSGLLSIVKNSLTGDAWAQYTFAGVFFVIGLGMFWCVLRAAGIARSRTRIALDASFQALWEVIGDAGNPPRDHAKLFATIATIMLVLVWVIVPAIIAWAAINPLGKL
ncbi:hypothetical protein [Aeromicrobium sp. NPDC092404]|uniref:hypothetical protein n=1 Tax=Aeromicrobium sp. NPDC092404 TaxID=3154976 RepID=UPI00343BE6A2